MKRTHFSHILLFSILVLFSAAAFGQTVHNTREDAEKNAGQGITFKTPDKFMSAPLAGFKGMLMLDPDSPAAIVVSYPNENESPEDLSKRLLAAVPKFFGDSKDNAPEWTSKPIEVNLGDKPGSGTMYSGIVNDTRLQLALFIREWKGLTVAYGYFAMRKDKYKEGEVKKYWLDDAGKGVKRFDSFWKSFPEK